MTDFRRTRAHTQYRTADGASVPGVTTVLGVLAIPGLVPAAVKLTKEGKDYQAEWRIAAEIGTLAHSLIADQLLGTDNTDRATFTDEQHTFAAHCLLSWGTWRYDRKPKPILVETPLVSERYRYGGTIDLYGKVGRRHELIDLKTGKAIYDQHLSQLAAYRQLLLEAGHTVTQARILRIGRNPSEGWEERIITDFGPHWRRFQTALAAWREWRGGGE